MRYPQRLQEEMDDPAHRNTVVTAISRIVEKPTAREACLVLIYGQDLGKKYNLDSPEITIGRSSKCDIQVDQEAVSRQHARIVNTGKSILLRDLGSTNGTYVNDHAVDEYVLTDGDLVKIGRTIFKFLSGGNIENQYHEEIYRLTTIDGLTQVFNKRYFSEQLERELSRSRRYRRELTLILLDIDLFKQINDTHGHLAGDQVLRQLAATIRGKMRREDIFARFGGEEFAIILPETDLAAATQFAEKVRKLVERTVFKFEALRLRLTISLGIAASHPDLPDTSAFVKLADDKLLEAKAKGRNCVCS